MLLSAGARHIYIAAGFFEVKTSISRKKLAANYPHRQDKQESKQAYTRQSYLSQIVERHVGTVKS
jgi:hypothetical protein